MQLRLIQRLVALMQKGDVTELEVEDNQAGLRVRLKRGGDRGGAGSPLVHVTQAGAPALAAPVAVPQALGGAPLAAGAPESAPPPAPAGVPFPSPMVGTFYRAASPEAEPFAQTGSVVGPDTTVCIIEAMKVMNEIKAETSGRIVQVLVQNGEPVEFGQPLFLIQPT